MIMPAIWSEPYTCTTPGSSSPWETLGSQSTATLHCLFLNRSRASADPLVGIFQELFPRRAFKAKLDIAVSSRNELGDSCVTQIRRLGLLRSFTVTSRVSKP